MFKTISYSEVWYYVFNAHVEELEAISKFTYNTFQFLHTSKLKIKLKATLKLTFYALLSFSNRI